MSLAASPRSTFICETLTGLSRSTLLVQCLSMVTDAIVLLSVQRLLRHLEGFGATHHEPAPLLFGFVLLVSWSITCDIRVVTDILKLCAPILLVSALILRMLPSVQLFQHGLDVDFYLHLIWTGGLTFFFVLFFIRFVSYNSFASATMGLCC